MMAAGGPRVKQEVRLGGAFLLSPLRPENQPATGFVGYR